jgi:hypothetical protein
MPKPHPEGLVSITDDSFSFLPELQLSVCTTEKPFRRAISRAMKDPNHVSTLTL